MVKTFLIKIKFYQTPQCAAQLQIQQKFKFLSKDGYKICENHLPREYVRI